MTNTDIIHDVIALDDAICALTPDGVLIDPLARPIRWLAFWAIGIVLLLAVIVWVASVFSLHLSILGVMGWLLRNLFLLVAIASGVGALYNQWKSLRQPVVGINPDTELIEVLQAHAVRRIPFSVVTSLRIAADPANNPVDHILNRIFVQVGLPRRGIGLVLQHGEVVWCGTVTGPDAAERARDIRHRISECITSTR